MISHVRKFPRRALLGLLLLALVVMPGCGKREGGKVLVIGLDGATWKLLDEWIARGDLPNIAKFKETSAWGNLSSVVPYLSPPAWTSAFTGVNPGRHGIFDFQRRIPGQGMVVLQETSRSRRATPIWGMIKGTGLRSACINIPMTDPPDEVDGIMIGGLPHVDKAGWSYPRDLAREFPDYILDSMQMQVPEGKEDSVLAHIHETLEARWDAVRALYQREDWDLFWVVFTQTDRIQHMFWGYMEPYDPRFDPEKAYPYRNAVHDLWVRQDEIIGELLAMTDPGTTVLMVSDHGFGPIYRELRVMPHIHNQTRSRLLKNYETEIYAIDPFNASQLYVAVEGRDPGAVIKKKLQGRVLDDLQDLLETTLDPETGEPVAEESWLKDEVFRGMYADKGPDLTVLTKSGYFFVRAEAQRFDQDVDPVGPLSITLSGWHEMDGIYAIRGNGIVPGRRDVQGERKYNLMDITPTLLYLLGEPVPEGLDGIVMTGLLDPELLEGRPVEYRAPFDEVYREDEIPDSTEIDQLKNLPYIGG